MAGKSTSVSDDIRITDAWKAFIAFAHLYCPFGEITVKVVNGEPSQMVNHTRDIDFRKRETFITLLVEGGAKVDLNGVEVFDRMKHGL